MHKVTKCLTCGRPLSEKQLKRYCKGRIPQYCSTLCWGKRQREHNYDDTFLNRDTEFAAYFMGFWVADGHISRRDKGVSITSIDKQIIDVFIKSTLFNNTVRKRQRNARKTTEYCMHYYGDVSNQIQKMGYLPGAKSGKEFIPDRFRQEPLLHHFVRGFFDGDGHIGLTKKGSIAANIVNMSKQILDDIHKYLYENKIIRGGTVFKAKPTLWKLQFGHFDTVQFCKWMYADASIKLARKHSIYISGKDYVQGTVPQTNTTCSWPGCENDCRTNGLCKKHYDKHYRVIYAGTHKEHLRRKHRRYYTENKEKINKRRREIYAENPEKGREAVRQWREENPEKVREYKRERNQERPDIRAKQRKRYRKKNHDKIREQEKASYERNKDNKLAAARAYKEAHKAQVDAKNAEYREKTKEKRREYDRKRYLARKQKAAE